VAVASGATLDMTQMTHPAASIRPARQRSPIVWAVLLVMLLLAGGVMLFLRGRAFYALDLTQRLDHPDRELLSPGAPIGHGYGVVGTALILTNLLYVIRRRFPSAPLGSMRAWLNLHATTGLFGTLLIAFHSAFQVRSPIASWTMLALSIVVLTGLIGRFIFAFKVLPDVDRLQAHLTAFDALGNGMGKELRARLNMVPELPLTARVGFFKALFSLPSSRRRGRVRREVVYEVAAQFERTHLGEVYPLRWRVLECAEIADQQASAPLLDALMRSWRGLHRFAAILMVLLVGLHVTVAWVFGYRWIFSQ
jgi:hypothetical protein